MVSWMTWVMSPIWLCTARLVVRKRTLMVRTTSTITGAITIASKVSFQLSHNIHASKPTITNDSLKIAISTLVAAVDTCVTSNVSLEIRLPEVWSS